MEVWWKITKVLSRGRWGSLVNWKFRVESILFRKIFHSLFLQLELVLFSLMSISGEPFHHISWSMSYILWSLIDLWLEHPFWLLLLVVSPQLLNLFILLPLQFSHSLMNRNGFFPIARCSSSLRFESTTSHLVFFNFSFKSLLLFLLFLTLSKKSFFNWSSFSSAHGFPKIRLEGAFFQLLCFFLLSDLFRLLLIRSLRFKQSFPSLLFWQLLLYFLFSLDHRLEEMISIKFLFSLFNQVSRLLYFGQILRLHLWSYCGLHITCIGGPLSGLWFNLIWNEGVVQRHLG